MASYNWEGEVTVVGESDKALRVLYENTKEWVPKSQILDNSEIFSSKQMGETGILVLPYWLAEEKGWA